jgi:hypothetical protein
VRRFVFAALLFGSWAAAVACSLNAQPLPPAAAFAPSGDAGKNESDATASGSSSGGQTSGDSGGGGDGGGIPDSAGIGDAPGSGSDAGEGGDAPSDAPSDAEDRG